MSPTPKKTNSLPVPVTDYPFWRVVYRPEQFNPELIPSLSDCFKLVEKAKVLLRGWDFPHLSRQPTDRSQGSNWISSWANFMGSIEYWQLFQSGQFIHLAAMREVTEPRWHAELKAAARSHMRPTGIEIAHDPPGFVSLVNLIYTITEIFEFAARICQAGVYRGNLGITVELNKIQGFVLTPEANRTWYQYCVSGDDKLGSTWNVSSEELVAGSADHSLKAVVWFCERLGWLEPNVEMVKREQQKLLTRRF